MKKWIVFLMLAGWLIPLTTQAQLGRVLKKAAEKKSSELLQKALTGEKEEADKQEAQQQQNPPGEATYDDVQTQEVNDNQSKRGTVNPYAAMYSSMLSDKGTAENRYEFSQALTMHMEIKDADGELEKGTVEYYFRPDGLYSAQRYNGDKESAEEAVIIMDMKNRLMITVSEKEQQALIIPLDDGTGETEALEEDEMEEEVNEEYMPNHPNYDKTGRTKTILGYSCDEYRYENDSVVSSYWVAEDFNMSTSKKMASRSIIGFYYLWNTKHQGTIMEMEMKSKQADEYYKTQVVDIAENTSEHIDMSSYQVINMGAFMQNMQETEQATEPQQEE